MLWMKYKQLLSKLEDYVIGLKSPGGTIPVLPLRPLNVNNSCLFLSVSECVVMKHLMLSCTQR